MDTIKLYRSKAVDNKWEKRRVELITQWRKDNKGMKFTSLFDNTNGTCPDWLKTQGVKFTHLVYCDLLENDYSYEDVLKHFTVIPNMKEERMYKLMMFEVMEFVLQNYWTNYAIVKKSEGSINYPHWHLLIYK